MTINSHPSSPSTSSLERNVIFEEVLEDFKSIEECAKGIEVTTSDEEIKGHNNIEYLQLQDFRRPKLIEYNTDRTSYRIMNRSYSMKEIQHNDLELRATRSSSQNKLTDHSFILSEFLL